MTEEMKFFAKKLRFNLDSPWFVEQLGTGEYAVGTLREEVQKLNLLRGCVHVLARDDELVGLLVNDEVVKGQFAAVVRGQTAQHSAYAGDDFAHLEGLYDVVIGTQFQTGYLVHGLALGRNHDDRHARARVTDFTDDLPAVHDRHHHVEQHHIGIFRLPLGQADRTVFRFGNVIALALEVQAQQLADVLIVLDDQDFFIAHVGIPTFILVCIRASVWPTHYPIISLYTIACAKA